MSEAMREYERVVFDQGYRIVAGVDEAGRGPLSGPVVAAAVIIPENLPVEGINDSKLLSPRKRAEIFNELTSDPTVSFATGIASVRTIDAINIYRATVRAMLKAIMKLEPRPDYVLLDGLQIPELPIPHMRVIKGDRKSISIAAASIIAKVTRDRIMKRYAERFPQYGFERHKGYGTALHRAMLKKHGPLPIHRRSFAPVRACLDKRGALLD